MAAVLIVFLALFSDNFAPETVESIGTAAGVLIAYIFGESAVDIAKILKNDICV